MPDALDRLYAYEHRRMRTMPDLIQATQRKLLGLYREAQRYGRDDLLAHKAAFDNAWETEIQIAKLEAQLRGEDNIMEGMSCS